LLTRVKIRSQGVAYAILISYLQMFSRQKYVFCICFQCSTL